MECPLRRQFLHKAGKALYCLPHATDPFARLIQGTRCEGGDIFIDPDWLFGSVICNESIALTAEAADKGCRLAALVGDLSKALRTELPL